MPRQPRTADQIAANQGIAARMKIVRIELYGKLGGYEMARCLGVPTRSWHQYESGTAETPARVVLAFILHTSFEPAWLLEGKEPIFRAQRRIARRSAS